MSQKNVWTFKASSFQCCPLDSDNICVVKMSTYIRSETKVWFLKIGGIALKLLGILQRCFVSKYFKTGQEFSIKCDIKSALWLNSVSFSKNSAHLLQKYFCFPAKFVKNLWKSYYSKISCTLLVILYNPSLVMIEKILKKNECQSWVYKIMQPSASRYTQ